MLKLKAFFKPQGQSVLRATLLLLVLAPAARAATNVVTSAGDDGSAATLRAVVAAAGSGDTIIFTNTLSGQTILLTNGQITLTTNLTIDGSTLASPVQLNGNGSNRVFYVNTGVTATFNSLIITNGQENSGGVGGGIQNRGVLTLQACVLANNHAGNGGGIFNYNSLTASNCTFSGNSATGDGGGVYNNSGVLIMKNCTLADNHAGDGGGIITSGPSTLNNCTLVNNQALTYHGGAIYNLGTTLVLNNCTLAYNTANFSGGGIFNNSSTSNLTNSIVSLNTGGDIYDPYSGSSNLVTVANINLAPLGNYGGSTMTMPPLPGSPAIDAGNDAAASSLATDQRSLPRMAGAHVDVGAVEFQMAPASFLVVNTNNDDAAGFDLGGVSLRKAVLYATNNATITFAPNLSGQTILLTNGQITLSTNVTIDGSTLPNGVTVSGNNASRLFSVAAGATAAFNSLTLKNGYDASGAGGGGIYVLGKLTLTGCQITNCTTTYEGGGVCNVGTLTVNGSTLASNNGIYGGGIYSSGTLVVRNSTLANNLGSSFGGGVFTAGPMVANNATFANNRAITNSGGGIIILGLGATLNLTNTIVALNVGGDVYGAPNASVNSLTNRPDINLAPLGNYGGPTPTMPPLPGSPVIDAGNDAVASQFATDQRGYPRVSGAHVDIGAVEAQHASAGNSPLLQNTAWSAANGGTLQFTFINTANTDFTALTATNVALPLVNWTVLGKVSQISAGQYQFAATNTAAAPQQFYRVVSP